MLIRLIRMFHSDSLLILRVKGLLLQEAARKKDCCHSVAANQLLVNTKVLASVRCVVRDTVRTT